MVATLSESVEQACRAHAGATAVYQADGTPVSFANFFFTLMAFAEQLVDRGVAAGDLVALDLPDAIAGQAMRLALLRVGAVQIPAGAVATPAAEGLRVDWLVTHAAASDLAPGARRIVVDPGWIRSPRRAVPVSGAGQMVSTTSGTTGTPKLRLLDEARLIARLQHGADTRGAPEGAAFIGYNPASSPGFSNGLRALLAGQAQVYRLADPAETLAAMARTDVRRAYVPPYHLARLVEAARAGAPRPQHLSRIMVGGAPVSAALAREAEALFGAEVFTTYGSSETGSIAHGRAVLAADHPGRVGAIYPTIAYRFQREDGSIAPPDEGGELWLQGDPARMPLAYPSGAALHDGAGWIATGDLGRILPDGALVLTGRRAEFLNIGGNKRTPAFFESLAREIAPVSEVAAFRLPGLAGDDAVGLALVAGPGFDLAALARGLLQRLGEAYPVHLFVLDRLPLTETGKIDRRALSRLLGPAAPHPETPTSGDPS